MKQFQFIENSSIKLAFRYDYSDVVQPCIIFNVIAVLFVILFDLVVEQGLGTLLAFILCFPLVGLLFIRFLRYTIVINDEKMIIVISKEMKNFKIKNNKPLHFPDILSIKTRSDNEVYVLLKSGEEIKLFYSSSSNPDLINEIKENVIKHVKHGYVLLKHEIANHNTSANCDEYYGIPLMKPECDALEDLERFIGVPIPPMQDQSLNKLGFAAKDQHVVYLSVPDEGLWVLPDSFRHFRWLESLHLPNNNLDQFPGEIQAFGELQILDLWGNDINSIPDWGGTFSRLQELVLGYTNILDLPVFFDKIENLKKMVVNGLNPIFFSRNKEVLSRLVEKGCFIEGMDEEMSV